MRLQSAEVLLLDVFDLHDRDRIVTFLTRDWGKKRGVARGARRKYSRFAGQLQPLAKVRATWFEKEGRDLVRLTAAELVHSAQHLQQDLEGLLLGSYLADHLLEFVQENEAADRYFRLLDSTLAALEKGADRELAARYFETWVLRLAGIFPAVDACPRCGGSFARSGARLSGGGDTLLCRRCAEAGRDLSAQALDLLRRMAGESLGQLSAKPPPNSAVGEVEEINAGIRRAFLQRELKSYRVIKETLAGV